MVYSRFFSILSLSLFVTTSLCASGKEGVVPLLNEDKGASLQRRGSRAALEEMLAAGPNQLAKGSVAQQKREEKKGEKKKGKDSPRLSRTEISDVKKLAKGAVQRRRTLSQINTSVPDLNILGASNEGAVEIEKKATHRSGSSSDSSSGSSSPPHSKHSPIGERRSDSVFNTFFTVAKKFFEIAEAEPSEDIVIGGPSINADLTKGKVFDPAQAGEEIGNLIKRVDAMNKMIGAHRGSGKQILDQEKYEFVLKGDLDQLTQMCVQGLKYCDPAVEYKEDDANAYLQNLKRFSESIGQELLWAMGQAQEPLLDQKLKDAKEKRDSPTISESFTSAAITHPIRRRRASTVGQGSQDTIVPPLVTEMIQTNPQIGEKDQIN